ncbi:hypothetical protein BLNAU_17346 [Blattamonas nauphoetae]|uniref:Uncharacterized protein n=1 Tax=Blattamonas nauphoetae TaxID=2049346 RepID=A0ABQ9X7E3_9EUKA|nr:hypothetical protein BLNAU_17346 [Blattamonas nauphoetae]
MEVQRVLATNRAWRRGGRPREEVGEGDERLRRAIAEEQFQDILDMIQKKRMLEQGQREVGGGSSEGSESDQESDESEEGEEDEE